MKESKLLFVTVFSLLFAWAETSVHAQWLPQPPTGSGPIYYTGGNVGIGTSVPSYFLHVVWSANSTQSQVVLQNTNSGTSASASFRALNDVGNSMGLGITGSNKSNYGALVANNASLYAYAPAGLTIMTDYAGAPIKFAAGNSTEKMRIDGLGNVGIGTSTPISLLQVNGNLSVGGGASAGVVGTAQVTTGGASPISNRIAFGTDGSGWEFAISKNQGGAVTDLVTVHDGGNVGIGTTTPPAQKLVVAGNAQLFTGGSLYGNTVNQALTLNSGSGSTLSYDANNYMSIGGNN